MIDDGEDILASDFISQSEADGTPSNDAGRVAKLESDGKLHPYFTKNGAMLTAGETISGATLPVPVYQNKTDNELYACDANDATKYKFIGFATSNSTDGNPIAFQGSGVVGGFSGLNEGEKYYVQDTAGTIGTSPGTHVILVGVAISTTHLLVQKGKHREAGTTSFSDAGNAGQTQTTAITLGFRPSVIRVQAGTTGSNSHGTSSGMWVEGAEACAFGGGDNSFGAAAGGAANAVGRLAFGGGANDYWTLHIVSVTDTGFSIQATQNANAPAAANIAWEAEGEL